MVHVTSYMLQFEERNQGEECNEARLLRATYIGGSLWSQQLVLQILKALTKVIILIELIYLNQAANQAASHPCSLNTLVASASAL